jgi:hypothetical protein
LSRAKIVLPEIQLSQQHTTYDGLVGEPNPLKGMQCRETKHPGFCITSIVEKHNRSMQINHGRKNPVPFLDEKSTGLEEKL